MADEFSSLAESALSLASSNGADSADVLISRSAATSIDVRERKLEQAESEESTELGLRVFVGNKQACVATSDFSRTSLQAVAERAVAMANVAPEDPYAGLAPSSDLSQSVDHSELDLFDENPPLSPEQLYELAARSEKSAAEVSGVSQVQSASAVRSQTDIFLAASNGFSGGMRRSGYSVYAVAIAGEGLAMERDSAGESRVHFSDLPDPEDIGRLAGTRAVSMLGVQTKTKHTQHS